MYRTDKNDLMFIRVSYNPSKINPVVEFQRIYSSSWYELNSINRAHKIQEIFNSDINSILPPHIYSDKLIITLAIF